MFSKTVHYIIQFIYQPDIIQISPKCHPNITQISTRYYPDIILISFKNHPNINLISPKYHTNIIQILPKYHPDNSIKTPLLEDKSRVFLEFLFAGRGNCFFESCCWFYYSLGEIAAGFL